MKFIIEAFSKENNAWLPAMTGMLNQTGQNDVIASTYDDISEVVTSVSLLFVGCDDDKIRIRQTNNLGNTEAVYTIGQLLSNFNNEKTPVHVQGVRGSRQ